MNTDNKLVISGIIDLSTGMVITTATNPNEALALNTEFRQLVEMHGKERFTIFSFARNNIATVKAAIQSKSETATLDLDILQSRFELAKASLKTQMAEEHLNQISRLHAETLTKFNASAEDKALINDVFELSIIRASAELEELKTQEEMKVKEIAGLTAKLDLV
ncbi:hypothetical protein FXE84_01660 [Vibrio cholerae]|uniref:hypothetical protein n=1 Tax=Vibrio cholerae TaxID=666 RepID=UPI0004E44829|nr:hypothetical protein [Vibrio cholerae]KFE28757.1 hypothetical protein DN30_254 [Vibrio cholerae]TXY44074.1 hypothetical protein FXE84_01660 [Vibrio cholerae]